MRCIVKRNRRLEVLHRLLGRLGQFDGFSIQVLNGFGVFFFK